MKRHYLCHLESCKQQNNKNMRKLMSSLLFLSLVLFLTSCDLDRNTTENEVSTDAKITAFGIYNDSIPTLKTAVFKVDQDAKTIANEDSIEYGSPLDSCYVSLRSVAGKITIGDKLYAGKKDTLRFDFRKPQDIVTVALDGETTLTYKLSVNVHHVDPDTMIWKPTVSQIIATTPLQEGSTYFNNQAIYYYKDNTGVHAQTSQKGKTWTAATVSGLDATVDLRHVVVFKDKVLLAHNNQLYTSNDGLAFTNQAIGGVQVSHLLYTMNDKVYGLQQVGKTLTLVESADLSSWSETVELPNTFPIEGEAITVCQSASGKMRVNIFGGKDVDGNLLNSLWATENNTYWANLMSGTKLAPRTGSALLKYGKRLLLIGGKQEDKVAEDKVLFSKDGGLTWDKPTDKEGDNALFVARYNCNVIDTQTGKLILVGGQTAETDYLKDVWTALLYKAMPDFKVKE